MLVLSACGSPLPRKAEESAVLGDNYARGGEQETALDDIPARWWEIFRDAELNRLVSEALRHNPGINQTRKRLEQAAALARRRYADLLPFADVSGAGGERTHRERRCR